MPIFPRSSLCVPMQTIAEYGSPLFHALVAASDNIGMISMQGRLFMYSLWPSILTLLRTLCLRPELYRFWRVDATVSRTPTTRRWRFQVRMWSEILANSHFGSRDIGNGESLVVGEQTRTLHNFAPFPISGQGFPIPKIQNKRKILTRGRRQHS